MDKLVGIRQLQLEDGMDKLSSNLKKIWKEPKIEDS